MHQTMHNRKYNSSRLALWWDNWINYDSRKI